MGNTDSISKDDLQMIIFIEERNQQSMDYFYDKFSPALYGIIYRIINNKLLAEECLRATFIKAWNEIANFRCSGTSLFTWLLNIARQLALEVITKENERNSGIHTCVNGHDQHYSAFELVYFKGVSVMQAAELSGITVNEFKTNLRMDLQNMKDKTEKV
ncbi:MAG: sigma factor [Ginsengibacter sp.]